MSTFFNSLGAYSRTFGTTMNGEVQKVLQKGAFAREELLSDVRELVRQHVERSPTPERVA